MAVYLTAPYTVPNTIPLSVREVKGRVKSRLSLCLDTETEGLDDPTLTLLQIGDHVDQYVIDTRFLTHDEISSIVKMLNGKITIAHNMKFDYKVLKKYGFDPTRPFDTMLASQVLSAGLKQKHSLKELVQRHISPLAYTGQGNLFMPLITKQIRTTFSGVDPFNEAQIKYAALDVEYTYQLYCVFSEKLLEHDLYQTSRLEFEFCLVAGDMELNGMPINTQVWLENAKEQENKAAFHLSELNKVQEINWNSQKQVMPILKSLGVDTSLIDRKTGEVKDSISKLVILKQREIHPIIGHYIDYKTAQKAASAYGEKFLRHINPNTGRIHADIFQIKDTGRTGCGNPNLQNIPNTIDFRRAFEAPVGRVFVIADYKNQELQVLADKSNEPKMIDAFKHGRDIHLETAKFMYDNDSLDAHSLERKYAKSTNFLASYGGGAHKLADAFNIPMIKAKEILKKYFSTYAYLEEYFNRTANASYENGYILIDDVVKRKVFISNYHLYLFLKHLLKRAEATNTLSKISPRYKITFSTIEADIKRKSMNYPIQGQSANISKYAGILLRRRLKLMADKDRYKILMLIHDEWLLECEERHQDEVKQILSSCMEEASKRFMKTLTIKADAVVSKVWNK